MPRQSTASSRVVAREAEIRYSLPVPAALDDLRVIDISTTFAGAWCTRMLADFGADVTVIEPAAGHPLRRLGPFDEDGASIPARHLFINKKTVTLDPVQGSERLLALLREADVVVSSASPRTLRDDLRLTYDDIGAGQLVMTHVTPHGMSGPLAEVPGNDLTVAARSGWASINGMADREPLKPSGWQVSYCTGSVAYAATLAAIHHRNKTGGGQEVDVSALDVMVSAFAPALLRSLFSGEIWRRRQTVDVTTGPIPVADGHFALTISRAHFWREAMTVLGLEDLAQDDRWATSWYRQQNKDQYVDRVGEAMSKWDRMDLFDELAIRRVIAGPVLSMAELRANDHLSQRGFWRQLDGVTIPGPPFRMTETPATTRTSAPTNTPRART